MLLQRLMLSNLFMMKCLFESLSVTPLMRQITAATQLDMSSVAPRYLTKMVRFLHLWHWLVFFLYSSEHSHSRSFIMRHPETFIIVDSLKQWCLKIFRDQYNNSTCCIPFSYYWNWIFLFPFFSWSSVLEKNHKSVTDRSTFPSLPYRSSADIVRVCGYMNFCY